jgi:hypothetical protein
MRGGGASEADVVEAARLCEAIDDACNLEACPFSYCVCYKVRGDDDLFLSALADKDAPDFMQSLAHYLLDFKGIRILQYENDVLARANLHRENVVFHADSDRYRKARSLCEELYKKHALEYVLILLECPEDYKSETELGPDEYVQYLFFETVTEAESPYPIMLGTQSVIKERLKE